MALATKRLRLEAAVDWASRIAEERMVLCDEYSLTKLDLHFEGPGTSRRRETAGSLWLKNPLWHV